MEEEPNQFSESERIREAASEWLAKQDSGLEPHEQDRFFDWLAESPLHAEKYGELKRIWDRMNLLAEWRPEHSLEPNPDLLAVAPRRVVHARGLAWAGMAAVLAFSLLVWFLVLQGGGSEPTMLASGESARYYEHHVLEDGSVVELNRGGQVAVRFLEDRRLVDLLAGEAHFTVAKDEQRPFVVRARGTVVQAVGTAFNVSLSPDEVEVLVTEGKVLMNPSIATTRDSIVDELEPLVKALQAGQRSVVSLNSKLVPLVVEEVSTGVIKQRLAWKNETLDFTETPLSEVILEFNRRNHTQLVIADAELLDLPITAAIRPNRMDEFVELLSLTENVRSERSGLSKITLYLDR